MRVHDRALLRGGHYGQRSCEPHLQAEHMAAPTNAAKREKSSCQHGAVHTWHKAGLSLAKVEVCCWGKCGHRCSRLRLGHRPISSITTDGRMTAVTAVQRRAPVLARHRREHMRADPLVGIEDRDRHAVERPSSRSVGSRSGLYATAWHGALT